MSTAEISSASSSPLRLIQLWREGRFPIDKLITDYTFEDINQGFADSKDGSTIKPVVIF